MILVLLGTHELPFNRLLQEVENLVTNGTITDEVIAQVGNTKFQSDYITVRKFIDFDEMNELIRKASLIITHGGTGSIITGLNNDKKVIAMARLEKYGEHNDDHQLELINAFVQNGHILKCGEGQSLKDTLQKVENFNPKPFQSKREQLLNFLIDYIEKESK